MLHIDVTVTHAKMSLSLRRCSTVAQKSQYSLPHYSFLLWDQRWLGDAKSGLLVNVQMLTVVCL